MNSMRLNSMNLRLRVLCISHDDLLRVQVMKMIIHSLLENATYYS